MGLETIQGTDKSLPELVAGQIAGLIADNEYKKGEKLPNEFQLAQSLHVGRGTIREAIKILVSRNVVEIRRGLGTFVAEKPGLVSDPLGLEFMKNKKKLTKDLLEVRSMIEPEIAALAAKRATESDIEKILAACQAVEVKICSGESFEEEDMDFHKLIAKSSKNQVVLNVLPVIHSAIKELVEVTNAGLTEQTVRTHRMVADAIAQRNPQKAREAMLAHMLYNKEYLVKH
ncbi:FadR family transcriptional regulator [Faecalicatena acetigenes]|uniref:FadR family transcriptional regulator n=1 Tax=Faecalicatena acetigenes TaxID=2981790 RepID=A0ABT2T7R8_9FIRM|nr:MULTISPECIES: FadR/GntR family transcriptional regulator [Lachnospiraceae]MCU6746314.1 FadR family transcriptional regulator [Faecalicatena acetigenes]SCH07048.1 L-lactate utilization operon repressor [uncultured Clostridium sp.]